MDQTSPNSPPSNSPPPPTATTPAPLVVPKAFKYPEMYTSPTDSIMSPISKGLLARTRSKKSSRPLTNSSAIVEQHKIQNSKFAEINAHEI
ncbi:hypothetical protein QVD17_09821 [Tagetes erecta]|uniref:Uncharacterized protein n=1 Tax=Tagetes erecta TaxID=13708 RepID=A0AAD8P4B1_TARER|nr:hypothetical protein QVD17_09821 [Tagetes erecta]